MFDVLDGNYKGHLLEISVSHFGIVHPEYVHFEYGPHHAKVFLCICIFQEQTTSAKGRTKIEAEQFASREMLNRIRESFFEERNTEWIFSLEKKQVLPAEILNILADLKADSHFDVLSLYGDSVLRYFVAYYLFEQYSQLDEGVLTRITSEAVRQETRAKIAERLSLEEYVCYESTSRALAQTLSAAVGKLTLVSEACSRELIMKYYQPFIDLVVATILKGTNFKIKLRNSLLIKTDIHNFKGELLKYTQQIGHRDPKYVYISKEGPEHDPSFTVRCVLGRYNEIGNGKTKQSAEQDAAGKVLSKILRRDAASIRTVGSSASYVNRSQDFKVFDDAELSELEKTIKWSHFKSFEYLAAAFTHPSINPDMNYQLLEFLGDAILRKILLAYLLKIHPEISDAAVLSPIIDKLVSAETQASIARSLRLEEFLYAQIDYYSVNVLSDVLEALIAAVWLDAKVQSEQLVTEAENLIVTWFRKNIKLALKKPADPLQLQDSLKKQKSKKLLPLQFKFAGSELEPEKTTKIETVPDIDNAKEFPSLNGSECKNTNVVPEWSNKSNHNASMKNTVQTHSSKKKKLKKPDKMDISSLWKFEFSGDKKEPEKTVTTEKPPNIGSSSDFPALGKSK
ncbi:MAG: hypothetical protein JSS53_02895 [Proteobacteria bacterium]|nr:hypothetical protein [Pseudomonadota bacterium]